MTAPWTALLSLMVVVLHMALAVHVGRARARTGIKAPAMQGHPDLERAYRVQMNTLEQTLPFLLPLWIAALAGFDLWAALLGLVWLAGRAHYAVSYQRDPAKRGPGFLVGFLANLALLALAAWAVLRTLL